MFRSIATVNPKGSNYVCLELMGIQGNAAGLNVNTCLLRDTEIITCRLVQEMEPPSHTGLPEHSPAKYSTVTFCKTYTYTLVLVAISDLNPAVHCFHPCSKIWLELATKT